MRSLGYALLIGLLGAGLVHGAVLLLLPVMGQSDAWSRLSARVKPFVAERVDPATPGGPLLPEIDPFFRAAVCRYDVSDAPMIVTAEGEAPFWSVSVLAPNGDNLFSFNDRTGSGGKLDLVVLTTPQMADQDVMAPDGDGAPAQKVETPIFAEVASRQGLVLVRVFVPDPSWDGAVDEFLKTLECRPEAQ